MTPPADAAPRARGAHLLGWLGAQLGHFGALVGQMLLVGAVMAMLRRRFCYRAAAAALAIMVAGIGATGAYLVHADAPALRAPLLWLATLASMALAGFVAARLARTVAFWELYIATLLLAVLAWVQLWRGWPRLLGLGGDPDPSQWDLLAQMSPGALWLGPMWDRLLALALTAGFLLAVVGASLAFIWYADGARRDTGMAFEWQVARRYLAGGHGARASLTAVVAVLGIALGVASLVTVTAVMSGYQQDIQAKILSANAHLVVQKYGIDFHDYARVTAAAAAVPGVCAAAPFIFNEAMLSSDAHGVGVLVKGVAPDAAAQVTGVETNLCESVTEAGACVPFAAPTGSLRRALAPVGPLPSAIVGLALFRRLHLPLGARVSLTTPVGVAGARGNAPKRLQFRIGGVFRSGMYEFDSRLVYLDLPAAQELLGMGDTATGVELRLADPDAVDVAGAAVLGALGRYPYRTLTWRELNAGIFTALKLQKVVMFLVLTFIVVVASFNIASTLFMAVVEKAREIAVLKSMGARDASIMKIFVLQGWLTGGTGITLGVALGLGAATLLGQLHLGIAADVYMVDALQVRVRPTEVLLVMLAALVISHLATLYPALRAARQRPIDAMRAN